MEILSQILAISEPKGASFLVIGGHAINAHGYPRQTGDLDFLVSKEDREFWLGLMKDLKYKEIQSHEIFARFKPNSSANWPIDFMFVDQDIFQQLYSSSVSFDFGKCSVQIPSIEHLIALKLHALKQRQDHRESRDVLDVKELLKLSSLSSEELRQLCEKYDRIDLYDEFEKICSK